MRSGKAVAPEGRSGESEDLKSEKQEEPERVAPPGFRRDPWRGFLFALGGTVFVSTNFVTAKYALEEFNPESFSAVWTTAGALYALGLLVLSGGRSHVFPPRKSLVKILLLGVLTAAGMILTWAGLSRLDPSFASFLWRFMPVMILLFGAVFLGERLRLAELGPLALMIAGGVWSTLGRFDVVGAGLVLTLCACVAGALQMLIARFLVAPHPPVAVVFYRLGAGAAAIWLWTIGTGNLELSAAPRYWAVAFLGAFLGPCFSHILTFRSYRYWEFSRSGIVVASQPLFVLPMAILFLGKVPEGRELLGGLLILLGALWLASMHLGLRRTPPAPLPRLTP